MSRTACIAASLLLLAPWCAAQMEPKTSGRGQAPTTQAPPRSDESSSRDTRIDLSPPGNDNQHAGAGGANGASDVGEFKKYDPHRADKDLEVAEYYAKQGNYRAALWRYQDALEYMPNNPTATFKLAQAYAQLGQPQPAARFVVLYLRLAP